MPGVFCPDCAAPLPKLPPVTCQACGSSHWRNPKPCSGALVTHQGKLLLVRRAHDPWAGRWDIPGGFCEPGEHPVLTAVRELEEETGLAIDVTALAGMWMDTYGPPGDDGVEESTLNLYYFAELAGPDDPRPDPAEVSEIRWMGLDELPPGRELAFPDQEAPVLALWRAAMAAGGPPRHRMPDDPRPDRRR